MFSLALPVRRQRRIKAQFVHLLPGSEDRGVAAHALQLPAVDALALRDPPSARLLSRPQQRLLSARIDGWQLQSVRGDAAIVASGQQTHELRLYPTQAPNRQSQ